VVSVEAGLGLDRRFNASARSFISRTPTWPTSCG
jgi:hypothetical protein